MSEYDFSRCIEHEGKIYCTKQDGAIVMIDVKDVPIKDCPECVIKALLRGKVC